MATHGIRRIGFLLLGGPGETRASVDESLDFGEFLHLEMLNFTVAIRLYPPSSRLLSRNRPEWKPMRPDSAYQTQRECLLAGLSVVPNDDRKEPPEMGVATGRIATDLDLGGRGGMMSVFTSAPPRSSWA